MALQTKQRICRVRESFTRRWNRCPTHTHTRSDIWQHYNMHLFVCFCPQADLKESTVPRLDRFVYLVSFTLRISVLHLVLILYVIFLPLSVTHFAFTRNVSAFSKLFLFLTCSNWWPFALRDIFTMRLTSASPPRHDGKMLPLLRSWSPSQQACFIYVYTYLYTFLGSLQSGILSL